MGNKITKRRSVDEQFTKPQGLYDHDGVDLKKLKVFIQERRLSPCYPGVEQNSIELEECPICFLNYPSLNRSKCCSKGLCTECFLQMRSQSGRVVQCPFCKYSPYAVEYRGELSQEEKELEYAEEQKFIEARIRMLNASSSNTEQNSEVEPPTEAPPKEDPIPEKKSEPPERPNPKSDSKSDLLKWSTKLRLRNTSVQPNQLSASSSKAHKFFQIIHPSSQPSQAINSPDHDVIQNVFWDSSNGRYVHEDGSNSIFFPVSSLQAAHPVESEEWQRYRDLRMRQNHPTRLVNSDRVYNGRPPHSIPHELDFISTRATSDSSGSELFSPFHVNEVDLEAEELMYMEAVLQSLKDYELFKANNAINNHSSIENHNSASASISNAEGSSSNSTSVERFQSSLPVLLLPSSSSSHASGNNSSVTSVFDAASDSHANPHYSSGNQNQGSPDELFAVEAVSNAERRRYLRAKLGKQRVDSQDPPSPPNPTSSEENNYGMGENSLEITEHYMPREMLRPFHYTPHYPSGTSNSSSRGAVSSSRTTVALGNGHANNNEATAAHSLEVEDNGSSSFGRKCFGPKGGSRGSNLNGSENRNGGSGRSTGQLTTHSSTNDEDEEDEVEEDYNSNNLSGGVRNIPSDFEDQLQLAIALSLADAEKASSKRHYMVEGRHGEHDQIPFA